MTAYQHHNSVESKYKTMRTTAVLLAIASTLCPVLLFASPEIPGKRQAGPIVLTGGTIHPVSGKPIEGGVLVFDNGQITAIGKAAKIPEGATQLDVTGKHVYPGLFESSTNIGLVEINAVRATRDQAETGSVNPNVKAQVAFNPDSELIPVTRANGVLLALTVPSGGLISGKSAVMQLDGWTWEDMTVRKEAGMHLNWPRMSQVANWQVTESAKEQAAQRDKELKRLKEIFSSVRAYQRAREADEDNLARDLRWEAMLPVIRGELPLIVSADDAQQIQAAVAFAAKENLKIVIYGGYDAEACAELLRMHDVPVIIGGVYRLPRRRGDDYDASYTLPERLRAAGIKFCIAGEGRFGASNSRNLPYHAATAVAYGLPHAEALKAITLYPAEILGVANRVGSLEIGKDATLIIADGDPLETATQVEAAFIQGRRVEMNDRHKRLWRKYQQKYRDDEVVKIRQ